MHSSKKGKLRENDAASDEYNERVKITMVCS